ncbi:MAG: hypothetical protein E7374_04125 [Clostridiales bacterium]|nr:hypothetical protein [Clostridiales bacterium]
MNLAYIVIDDEDYGPIKVEVDKDITGAYRIIEDNDRYTVTSTITTTKGETTITITVKFTVESNTTVDLYYISTKTVDHN